MSKPYGGIPPIYLCERLVVEMIDNKKHHLERSNNNLNIIKHNKTKYIDDKNYNINRSIQYKNKKNHDTNRTKHYINDEKYKIDHNLSGKEINRNTSNNYVSIRTINNIGRTKPYIKYK